MIELIHVSKTYCPKKGVPVNALKDVSVRFPEKGLVFLLGKSGSGKSTLLNLCGGLDVADEGEVRIAGQNLRECAGKALDACRNTCIGFVFQEYNLLPEFSVGANISLALELQGETVSEAELEQALDAVGLSGFADRKPGELSGGQRQRVAIARALIKNPKVLLADEPTGALDSKTGRQIFELLQKLSGDKLVLVVSHDREYSERYADRIIELSDGRVISDTVKQPADAETMGEPVIRGNIMSVPAGYRLTQADRERMNAYLASEKAEPLLVRQTERTGEDYVFAPTDPDTIPKAEEKASFVSAHLPLRRAAGIAWSSLVSKKGRMAVTAILCTIALLLCSFFDAFASFRYEYMVADSLEARHAENGFLMKQGKSTVHAGEEDDGIGDGWDNETAYGMSEAERQLIEEKVAGNVFPIYRFDDVNVKNTLPTVEKAGITRSFFEMIEECYSWDGFVEVSDEMLSTLGYRLVAGRLPDGSANEIAVSKCFFELTQLAALSAGEKFSLRGLVPSSIIGREYTMSDGTVLTVTGVVDTNIEVTSLFNAYQDMEKQLLERKSIFNIGAFKALAEIENFLFQLKGNAAQYAMVGEGFCKGLLERKQETVYDFFSVCLFANSSRISLYVGDGTLVSPERITPVSIGSGEKDIVISEKLAKDIVQMLLPKASSIENGINLPDEFLKQAVFGSENASVSVSELTTDEYAAALSLYLDSMSAEALGKMLQTVLDIPGYTLSYAERLNMYNENLPQVRITGLVKQAKDYETPTVYCFDRSPFLPDTCPFGRDYGGFLYRRPETKEAFLSDIRFANDGGAFRYALVTSCDAQLRVVEGIMDAADGILLYVVLFFALFAVFLFMRFVSVSIMSKKHEIGILRAIGSGGGDVYRIFGTESLYMAMICFVLSVCATWGGIALFNRCLLEQYGLMMLRFTARQVLVLFVISILMAVLASILPVWSCARKKPIDAIRDR